MKVCETFVSFQGEINVGRFAFFIRLSGCSLNCKWCDSKYHTEGVDISVDDLAEQAMYFPNVVITGGEPFVQKEEVSKLIKKIQSKNQNTRIEIETNGSIRPTGINNFKNLFFNVSIKLSNSGNDLSKRVNSKAIAWFNDCNSNYKFVVQKKEDVEEVEMLAKEHGIKKVNIFLMPEGKTAQEQLDKMDDVIKWAKIYGYSFSPRFHVLLWGDKRGV